MMKILILLFSAFISPKQLVHSTPLEDDIVSMSSRDLGSRVIGGYAADPKKYPFYTWLNIQLSSIFGSDTTFCGGSLIAPDVVMTAAHCLEASVNIDVWVNSTTRKVSDYEYFRKSIRKVVHPKYKTGSPGYDIALVFLDSPVKEVSTVTRNTNTSLPGNIRTLVTAIGLGRDKLSYSGGFPTFPTTAITPIVGNYPFAKLTDAADTPTQAPRFKATEVEAADPTPPVRHRERSLEDSSPYPEQLMEVQFYSVPRIVCLKTVGTWKVHESEICASEGKKGACYGDSGGPLFLIRGSKYIQIGVVSRTTASFDCLQAKMPQIYTSTAYFATWIDENICKYSKHKPKTCSTSKPSPSKPSLKPTSKIP
jgi:secreted trypsin-like serine protease